LQPCQYGQDFRCVDDFDWNVPYPNHLRVRARNYAGQVTEGGWNVQACQTRDQCAQPLTPPVQTDPGGFATLALGPGDSSVGYLRFIAPTGFVPWEISVTRPFASGDYSSWGFIDDDAIRDGFHQFIYDFDADHGLVMVVPFDCAGFNAKHVSVEAWLDTPNGLEQCGECRMVYEDNEYAARFTPRELSTKGRQVYIGMVPPRLVHVVVRRSTGPGTVVSVASINVNPGEGHIVRTYPASIQERATFPY
jgi:hypothetical protein